MPVKGIVVKLARRNTPWQHDLTFRGFASTSPEVTMSQAPRFTEVTAPRTDADVAASPAATKKLQVPRRVATFTRANQTIALADRAAINLSKPQ